MRYACVLLLCCAAACGGGAESTGANPSPPPAPPGPPPTAASVSVRDYSYSPATVTVKVGGSVTWTNRGTVGHTATGSVVNSPTLAAPGGGAYGGTAGESHQQSFGGTGSYSYHCAFHPQMTGTVLVVP